MVTNDYPLTFNIDNTVSGKHAQWYFLMTPETSVLVRSLLSDIMLCHPLSWCSWYHALVRRLTVYTVSSIAYSIASLLISSIHILMTIQIYLVKEKMSLLCWLSSSSRKVIEHLPLSLSFPSMPSSFLSHFWDWAGLYASVSTHSGNHMYFPKGSCLLLHCSQNFVIA